MAIAAAKTVREPKRSATHPLIGMKTASVNIYALMPALRAMGVACSAGAICGSAVAITVPSRFSMKKAPATSREMRTNFWR